MKFTILTAAQQLLGRATLVQRRLEILSVCKPSTVDLMDAGTGGNRRRHRVNLCTNNQTEKRHAP